MKRTGARSPVGEDCGRPVKSPGQTRSFAGFEIPSGCPPITLKTTKTFFSNIGFFVISPQGISIGSMRDSNTGSQNLIARKYPKYIKKAFDGQVSFVPPMDSDVQLGKASGSKQERKPPTMFFIGPIQNPEGKVLAVMTLRVDPLKDFSRILHMSLSGAQATYAFDDRGRLVTNSKYDAQLRQIGLIGKEETAALHLEIRDPGGNMLNGYRPTTPRDKLPLTRAAAGAIALKLKMEEIGATFGHSEIGVDIKDSRRNNFTFCSSHLRVIFGRRSIVKSSK